MKTSQLKSLIRHILNEVHSETDMHNPEEKREVQIGREILNAIDDYNSASWEADPIMSTSITKIEVLADELIKMHSQSIKEGEAFTSNLEMTSDSISENNVVDELDLSGRDFAPVEHQCELIKSAWKQLIQHQNNPQGSEDVINHLYQAVSSLENICKGIRVKLDAGLK